VLYDQLSLQRGGEFDVDFCTGIARSLVGLPVVSVQAMERMRDTPFVTSASMVDNVLLEWMMMLVLHKAGRVQRVVPVVLGECWPNDRAPPQHGIDSFGKLALWVETKLTDQPATGTVTRLEEILPRLGLKVDACEGIPVSPRGVATALLRFDAIVRINSPRPVTSHLGGMSGATTPSSVSSSWALFEALADKVRVLVDGLQVKREPDQIRPRPDPKASDAGRVGPETLVARLCTGPYASLVDCFPPEFLIENLLDLSDEEILGDIEAKHRLAARGFLRKFLTPLRQSSA
jgi:hypothetical protein